MTPQRSTIKPTWKVRAIDKIRNRLDAHRILELRQSPFSVL